MSITKFSQNDIIVEKLDIQNAALTISTTAQANASGLWVYVQNSTTAGFLYKPDTSSNSASTISTSASFRHDSNFFFGLNTYIPDSYDNTIQRTTVRVISLGRPVLDEGFYKNTLTAVLSATLFSITAKDIADTNSEGSPFGLTGSFIDSSNTANKIGTVFYDHGIIILHGGSGSSSALISSSSGFSINSSYAARPNDISLVSFRFQTRNILKRSTFFCRALNYQYNYTTNPTARNSDGSLISSLSTNPATYITTVGLYGDDGTLLAVGKLSTPTKKSFTDESIFKVSIDI
jgi:hypothetical protein